MKKNECRKSRASVPLSIMHQVSCIIYHALRYVLCTKYHVSCMVSRIMYRIMYHVRYHESCIVSFTMHHVLYQAHVRATTTKIFAI